MEFCLVWAIERYWRFEYKTQTWGVEGTKQKQKPSHQAMSLFITE